MRNDMYEFMPDDTAQRRESETQIAMKLSTAINILERQLMKSERGEKKIG